MKITTLKILSLYLAGLMLLQASGLSIDVRSCSHCGVEWAISGGLDACATAAPVAEKSCCSAKTACKPTPGERTQAADGCCTLQTLAFESGDQKVASIPSLEIAKSDAQLDDLTVQSSWQPEAELPIHEVAAPPIRRAAPPLLTRYRYKWVEQYLI